MPRTRTMVYLEAEQHRALRGEAALLRRIVARHLDDRKGRPKVSPATYMKIVGLGASGRADVSQRHDAYLVSALRRDRAR